MTDTVSGVAREALAGDRWSGPGPAADGSPATTAVRRVLSEPELVDMAFQPIVDLGRGVVCGYEALARFPTELGPPDVWIAAARAVGLGDRLEALLVGKALDARPHLPANCFLSLNVSLAALASSVLYEVLCERPNLSAVVLEVTEQTDVAGGDLPRAALDTLRRSGAALAVDDAGSGYGSLNRILELRPEFVKVDKGLVGGVDGDEAKGAAIEMLGGFAGRTDAWIIAEGVERVEELQALARLGVPLAQGHLFAAPSSRMVGLSPELAQLSRERFHAGTAEAAMIALLEGAPTIVRGERSAGTHGECATTEAVVIVDERRRPIGLLPGGVDGGGEPHRPLLVHAADEVADVARRAMTRSAGERFDPVVCCDEAGRYLGLVPVHRLVLALSDGRSPAAAGRDHGTGLVLDMQTSEMDERRTR